MEDDDGGDKPSSSPSNKRRRRKPIETPSPFKWIISLSASQSLDYLTSPHPSLPGAGWWSSTSHLLACYNGCNLLMGDECAHDSERQFINQNGGRHRGAWRGAGLGISSQFNGIEEEGGGEVGFYWFGKFLIAVKFNYYTYSTPRRLIIIMIIMGAGVSIWGYFVGRMGSSD